MSEKEATARIKINRLLDASGWRFFGSNAGPANIRLEPTVVLTPTEIEKFGDDFKSTKNGFVDFLLLDPKGFPLIVLEAKAEDKDPLIGKEQARTYAKSQNCRFIILSNGNLHYFWDLERGNPYHITTFPTPDSVVGFRDVLPNPSQLISEVVGEDFIVLTQKPSYRTEVGWVHADEREEYIRTHKLRFLRKYQLDAIRTLQSSAKQGKDRFLFEMATGTGKTLTSAAIMKLFLKTCNARRVLFLVDRLELEDQAKKAFSDALSADFQTVIYKENRDDWQRAEIVVSTVQSLLFNNKYQRLFSPTDFDLVISDEAHRSIGGNARAVFDYFVGYKLGLTATPRDYLRRLDGDNSPGSDPRQVERRLLLDTYRTFGCDSGTPTFRYSLLDGVRDGYLISPTVVDARTEVTAQLLSSEGYVVSTTGDAGEEQNDSFKQNEFERRFFSEATNQLLCKTFLENALRDPISGEIGKSIVFAVSQRHAAKLTQIFNEIADRMYPDKYRSDFAVQITSSIPDAQQFTINFANNNLLGNANFMPAYKTSLARVCVTVGMMTTGYDCTDILNIGLFRPIFSPTDFIQIKGRGTRKHNFKELLFDAQLRTSIPNAVKTSFKIIDFFANCEYFEVDFNYDEVLELPPRSRYEAHGALSGGSSLATLSTYEHVGADLISGIRERAVGIDGMKIDRMFFDRFGTTVRGNLSIAAAVDAGQWDRVIDLVNKDIFNQPEDYYTLEKLRAAAAVDRRVSLREIIENIFGLIPELKSRDKLLEEEFSKFVVDHSPSNFADVTAIKHFFKAYVTNGELRDTIEHRQFTDLATNPIFTTSDYRAVPERFRTLVPEYVKDYVALSQFAA